MGFSQRNIMASCGVNQKTVVKVQKELLRNGVNKKAFSATALSFCKTPNNIYEPSSSLLKAKADATTASMS